MPELEYFLVAESVSTDKETNRISVFNVLEEIPRAGVLPQCVATSCWRIEPEDEGKDFQVTLRIHMPGGDVPNEPGDIGVNFAPEGKRHRIQHFIAGFPFAKPGDWEFEVLLNGKHEARHVVTVHEGQADG